MLGKKLNNKKNNKSHIEVFFKKKNNICMIKFVTLDNNIICTKKKYEFQKYIRY